MQLDALCSIRPTLPPLKAERKKERVQREVESRRRRAGWPVAKIIPDYRRQFDIMWCAVLQGGSDATRQLDRRELISLLGGPTAAWPLPLREGHSESAEFAADFVRLKENHARALCRPEHSRTWATDETTVC